LALNERGIEKQRCSWDAPADVKEQHCQHGQFSVHRNLVVAILKRSNGCNSPFEHFKVDISFYFNAIDGATVFWYAHGYSPNRNK
jgi:hypothetical protein